MKQIQIFFASSSELADERRELVVISNSLCKIHNREIRSRIHESKWEVKLRNHKDNDITVDVVELLSDNWKMISNSLPYEKVDAFTIKFKIDVPKDGEVSVKYRIWVGLL